MTDEFHDLTVTVSMSYAEAEDTADVLLAYGGYDSSAVVDMIRYAIREAVKERRDQDRRLASE